MTTQRPVRPQREPALDEVLARVSALLAPLAVLRARPGAGPPPAGWVTASRLREPAAFAALRDAEAARLSARHGRHPAPHVAAGLLLERYVEQVAYAVAGPLVVAGAVPRLRGDAVAVGWGAGERTRTTVAADGWVTPPSDESRPDEGRLLDAALDQLHDHLDPVLVALAPRLRRSEGACRRAVADVTATALWWLGDRSGDPDRGVRLAERAGRASPGGPGGFRRLALPGGGDLRTRTRDECCLVYTLGAPDCFTCPRLDDDERRRRLGPPAGRVPG